MLKYEFKDEIPEGGNRLYNIIDNASGGIIQQNCLIQRSNGNDQEGTKINALLLQRIVDEINNNTDFIDKRIMKTPEGYILSERGVIKLKGENVDDIDLPGSYYCDSCIGLPVDGSFYMEVTTHPTSDAYAYQHIVDVNYRTEFARSKVGGTWSEWKQLTTTNTAVTYMNGWQPNGAEALLVKTGGIVLFNAVVRNGINTAGTPIIIIPEGYRPNTACNVSLITRSGNGLATVAIDGNMNIVTPAPDAGNVQIMSMWFI